MDKPSSTHPDHHLGPIVTYQTLANDRALFGAR